jgi:hypothetical protein
MKSPLRASLFTLAFTSYSALALANPAPATPAAPAAAPVAPQRQPPQLWRWLLPLWLRHPLRQPGVDFIRDVQPIFENKCLECHNPNKIKGKLLMDSAVALLKGGDTGPGLVAGKPDESEIIKRVVLPKDHDDIMPPKGGPLAANEVNVLKRWIAEGAKWPQGLVLQLQDPRAAQGHRRAAKEAAHAQAPPDSAGALLARNEARLSSASSCWPRSRTPPRRM